MAFSNLTRIVLYVVAGLSLLVILFFYASPKTIDMEGLDMRVEELMSPVVQDIAPLPAVDSAEKDSTAVGASTAADDNNQAEIFTGAEVQETSDINLLEHMSIWEYLVYNRTDILLLWAYILLILSVLSAVIFPLIQVASNPRALLRLAGVLGAAAVIIILSYLLASDTPIDIIGYSGESNRDPGTLKMVDTTLFVTYILFGLALLSILYSIISRVFK